MKIIDILHSKPQTDEDIMRKSSSTDSVPAIQGKQDVKVSFTETKNDDDADTEKKKVKKFKMMRVTSGPVPKLKKIPDTTTTMGSTTRRGQFVQLPAKVLGIIIGNLKKEPDLLSCRQVNKEWRTLVNDNILQERPLYFQVHLDCLNDQQTWTYNVNEIVRFNDCLQNSKNMFGTLDSSFPCVRFKLSNVGLDDENVQNFLDVHGPLIQSLDLHNFEVSQENDQLESLSRLLVHQAPTIKFLTLTNPTVKPKGISAVLFDNNEIQLPHLQKLEQGHFSIRQEENILEEIVAAAPNLQTYNILDGLVLLGRTPLDLLVSKGKLDILKKLTLFVNSRNVDLCQTFSDLRLKLESLTIELDYGDRNDEKLLPQVAQIINKILEYSKHTLTSIDPFYPLGHVTGIVFPILDKVKELKITNQLFQKRTATFLRHENPLIFPFELKLSKVFPNVKKVNLYGVRPTSHNLFPFNFVDQHEPCWPSVETVKINFRFEKFIQPLSHLFPNLKSLVVDGDELNFPLICRKIFAHMQGLESLKFFNVDCSLQQNKYPGLDSGLTGLSRQDCHRLSESKGMENVLDRDVARLPCHVSILELQGLKTLKIGIDRGIGPLLLSRVSGIYAFQRMPNLKVTVTVSRSSWSLAQNMNRQVALEVIAPFVHSTT